MQLEILLLKSWSVTVAAELLAALLFRLRKKEELVCVALVNTVTNPLLVMLLAVGFLRFPLRLVLIAWYILELFIVLAEGLIYRKALVGCKRPFLFSACANLLSFVSGYLLHPAGIF